MYVKILPPVKQSMVTLEEIHGISHIPAVVLRHLQSQIVTCETVKMSVAERCCSSVVNDNQCTTL